MCAVLNGIYMEEMPIVKLVWYVIFTPALFALVINIVSFFINFGKKLSLIVTKLFFTVVA
jgi:hypothetical protein